VVAENSAENQVFFIFRLWTPFRRVMGVNGNVHLNTS